MTINKQIILTSLILATVIFFFGITDVDLSVQNLFYNYKTHMWLLNGYMNPYKFYFYDGIKRLLIIIGVLLLLSLIGFYKKKIIKKYRRGILIVLLSSVLIPGTVSELKKETNMPCPKDEIQYGGFYPRTSVWQSYDKNFFLKNYRTKCWPAGHASGGFALLSLFFLFKKKRNKIIGLGIGLVTGWSMGLYKMIIGDHFLSHTIITMVLAWLIILCIVKFVDMLNFPKLQKK